MIPRYAPTYTVKDLLAGLRLSSDPEIESKLCARLRSFYNIKHVFLFGSGREALYAALKAYNHPGRVLIPAYNCIVVPEAVQFAGYTPAFMDIDRQSLSMTAEGVQKALAQDVKAVFMTHIFGIPCEIQDILNVLRDRDILVIEDAAPALGAEYSGQLVGSFGDAAAISFQSTKVISGEVGGALITNNDILASKVENIAQQAASPGNNWIFFAKAWVRKLVTSQSLYGFAQLGYRSLLGEKMYEVVKPQVQAPAGFLSRCPSFASALVYLQLDRLAWNVERRRKIALCYQNALCDHGYISLPVIPSACNPAWIQYPVMVEDKLAFYKHMQRNHIDVTWTYKYSCAESYGNDQCREALYAAKTVIGLPTNPYITDEQAAIIGRAANQFTGSQKGAVYGTAK